MAEPPPGMFGAKPAPKEEKKGGLFVIKSSKSKAPPPASVSPAEVAALSGRLRVIEERIDNLRRKGQVTDHNMLMHNKKIAGNIRDLDSDIKELRMDMEDLRSVIQQIISEMKKFASRNDVDIIKKYVDLWEPLNFVSRREVENIVRENIAEIRSK